jgi:alpha(1,3/1,4) fucosyltransferase
MTVRQDAVVGVVPHDDRYNGDALFDPHLDGVRDDVLQHWRRLKEVAAMRGIAFHTLDVTARPDLVVSYDRILDEPPAPWILYVSESHVTRPDLYKRFDELIMKTVRIFTHSYDLSGRAPSVRLFSIPQIVPEGVEALAENNSRRLIAMINANKRPASLRGELYTKRLRLAASLAKRGELDVYGPGWDRTLKAYSFYPPWTERIRARWKGPVESKHETLSKYDFCLAFDNARKPGYITEKVFDPMLVGCIPIYLGAPDIAEVLPQKTFLDYRSIGSARRLLKTICSMSDDEKAERRRAMRQFLGSEPFLRRFGVDAWVHQLLREIEDVISEVGSRA